MPALDNLTNRQDVTVNGRLYAVRRNTSGMFSVEVFMPTTSAKWRHWRQVHPNGLTATNAILAAKKLRQDWAFRVVAANAKSPAQ